MKKEFYNESGIDLLDYDVVGKFPYYKDGKWGSIQRGTAWKMYAEWLEKKLETFNKQIR